jgi:tetratricopeptide (TPR) repeat protein
MIRFKILSLIFFCLITLSAISQLTNKKVLTAEAREQLIQKALEFRKQENYFASIQQLDTILSFNQADAPILLFKGDLKLQSKQFDQAVTVYKKILASNYEKTIVQINLSYALFMNHQPAKALFYAHNAWENNKTNPSAIVNNFNALLWNIKTKEAAFFLNQQQHLITPAQILVLRARLYTTSGNYNKGLKYYDSLVKAYPDKYYVQEYSEVLLGKKEITQAEAIMQTGSKYFSTKEYNVFKQKLKAAQMQNAGTEFVFFKDVAQNTRIENIIWWQQKDGLKYRLRLSAGAASTTSVIGEKTNAQFFHATVNERWSKAWSGQTDIHLQRIQPLNSAGFTGLTGKQTIQYQPNDRKMIGIFYNTDILNFTASLLEKNIRSNDIGYVTHILLTGKNGFYSQGSWGTLNDNNSKMQFFGSLYHLFRTDPTLKGGVNFSYLHFKDSTIKTYFSPNRYLSTEVFMDYSTALPNLSKFYLQLQGAIGSQKIEQGNWQPNYRFMTEFGMRTYHFETSLKYQTSNVASSTGTGYKFDWLTLRLMWKW